MSSVTLSSKGQVVIPKDIRVKLGLGEGDRLDVSVEGDTILMCPRAGGRDEHWRSWRGRYRGLPLLDDLVEEHRREVEGERLP